MEPTYLSTKTADSDLWFLKMIMIQLYFDFDKQIETYISNYKFFTLGLPHLQSLNVNTKSGKG